ncbi:MAG: hypothetical protein GC181_11920 [Bacteroidetes bacterium]|nr:hypothetical protein [Bacteroidota bacterium]
MKKGLFYLIMVSLVACSTSDPEVENPYDNQKDLPADAIVNPEDEDVDPTTIQGLHKLIFAPTCANSGCHDGNFEPDFRTIESSYNTLVNQPLIKNDAVNPLTARVTPGNAETSMLIRRLTIDLNGNSGIMPLVVEPGSDWYQKKDEYISYIKEWINKGALNQEGKAPTSGNFPVQLMGVHARIDGSDANRANGYEPLLIPAGSKNVEIWVSFQDDSLDASALTHATINFSKDANNFNPSKESDLQYQSSPLTAPGFGATSQVEYHFKADFKMSSFQKNDVIWLRFTISDGVNDSEIPNDQSLFLVKKYSAIRVL